LVEQRIENPRVGGSIPPQATNQQFQEIRRSPGTSQKPLENQRSRAFLLSQVVA
jgi:hypothetical protein